MKINEDVKENPRDPDKRGARIDIWAREAVKSAKIKKKLVEDYIPKLHNPEPMYRPGSQDAFKYPSLVGKKRVAYWGYINGEYKYAKEAA